MNVNDIADDLENCARLIRVGIEQADPAYNEKAYWRAHDALEDLEAHIDPAWLASHPRRTSTPGADSDRYEAVKDGTEVAISAEFDNAENAGRRLILQAVESGVRGAVADHLSERGLPA